MQAKDLSDIQAEVGRDGLLATIQSNVVPIESVSANSWDDALSKAVVSSSELASLSLPRGANCWAISSAKGISVSSMPSEASGRPGWSWGWHEH